MTDSTPVVDTLVARFGGEKIVFAGEPSAILPVEKIVEAAKAIHDEFGFDMLSTITAVDYWPEENPRFHLFYRLAVRILLADQALDPLILEGRITWTSTPGASGQIYFLEHPTYFW